MTLNCVKFLEFLPRFILEIKLFLLLFLKCSGFFHCSQCWEMKLHEMQAERLKNSVKNGIEFQKFEPLFFQRLHRNS